MADLADIASEAEALHLRAAMARHNAQRREESGDGVCASCDDPIDPRRLDVMPHAALCAACQTIADRRRRTIYGIR